MASKNPEITDEMIEAKMYIPSFHEIYPAAVSLVDPQHQIEQVDLDAVSNFALSYAKSLRGVKKYGNHIIADRKGYSYIFRADGDLGQFELYFKNPSKPDLHSWQMEGIVIRTPNPRYPELSIYSKNSNSRLVERTVFTNGILTPALTTTQRIHLTEFFNRIKVPQRLLQEV